MLPHWCLQSNRALNTPGGGAFPSGGGGGHHANGNDTYITHWVVPACNFSNMRNVCWLYNDNNCQLFWSKNAVHMFFTSQVNFRDRSPFTELKRVCKFLLYQQLQAKQDLLCVLSLWPSCTTGGSYDQLISVCPVALWGCEWIGFWSNIHFVNLAHSRKSFLRTLVAAKQLSQELPV